MGGRGRDGGGLESPPGPLYITATQQSSPGGGQAVGGGEQRFGRALGADPGERVLMGCAWVAVQSGWVGEGWGCGHPLSLPQPCTGWWEMVYKSSPHPTPKSALTPRRAGVRVWAPLEALSPTSCSLAGLPRTLTHWGVNSSEAGDPAASPVTCQALSCSRHAKVGQEQWQEERSWRCWCGDDNLF